MDKLTFNSLEILKQIEYVNKQLMEGEILTSIAKDLTISKNTIRARFEEQGYTYSSKTKLYESVSSDINGLVSNTINVAKNVSSDIKTTKIESKDASINGNIAGNNNNSIIINKNIDTVKLKRVSYYLQADMIRKIEQLAKESNKGISEFLQDLLRVTLDKIEIK